jgi:hypothetical protein
VAFKALKMERMPGFLPDRKGLGLLSLRGRLVTAKLTGARPNVTILKILHRASIGKVDGLTGLAGTADNEQIAQTIRAVGNAAGLRPGFRPACTAVK